MLQWLLNSINVELFEIQESLGRIQVHVLKQRCSACSVRENGHSDLFEVLSEVESIEKTIYSVAKALLGEHWVAPISLPPVDIPTNENIKKVCFIQQIHQALLK